MGNQFVFERDYALRLTSWMFKACEWLLDRADDRILRSALKLWLWKRKRPTTPLYLPLA